MGKFLLGTDSSELNTGLVIASTKEDWWPEIINTPKGSFGFKSKSHLLYCYIISVIDSSLDMTEPIEYPSCLKHTEFKETREIIRYYQRTFLAKNKPFFSKFNKLSKEDLYSLMESEFRKELHENNFPMNYKKFIKTNLKKINRHKGEI